MVVNYISSCVFLVCEVSGLEGLDEWLPPEDRGKKQATDVLILRAIGELGIAYPAEIVGETGVNRQTVFDRLCRLRHEGLVEKVVLGREPPEVMKKRLPVLWEQGIKGNLLKRMSWYVVTEEGMKLLEVGV